jgi:catalase
MIKNMGKPDETLLIGREYPEDGEDELVAVMVQQMKDQLEDLYRKTMTLRQVHSKMHGCVKAEFIVAPGLPAEYKVGVFKEPKTFPAWIRFSNGNTKIQADKKMDTRGAAIKLMNVPGAKLLNAEGEDQTQDFVLAASKVFFAKDLRHFHGLMTASMSKNKLAIPLYFISHLKTAVRAVTKMLIHCKHIFAVSYNSVSPYRFGDETKAVKYMMQPTGENVLGYADTSDFNYLRKNMAATLAKTDIYFDFGLQFQTDAVKMPIEDGTVEWTSPFVKLATIRIPRQVFDTPEQNELGENLTYNAWHSLPEHMPLGGFNRGRKTMYKELYKFRLDRNYVQPSEPVAGPDFFNNLI